MESKKDIRRHILNKRSELNADVWERHTHAIFERVIEHPYFSEADVIYCYVDYRREVGTRDIIERAWELGKRLAVPKIVDNDMQFYYLSAFTQLTEGYKGIPEPKTGLSAQDAHALVIMPGVVFDRSRNRLGYGKGFYDRFLSKHPSYRTMAIAFELQMMDEIPADDFDIRPEVLITEEQIYV